MNFRTVIEPLKLKGTISHSDHILFMGSCFADNIGSMLAKSAFNIDVNPFGTTFNPLSIAAELDLIMSDKLFGKDDLFVHNGLWNSFMHHSSFSDSNVENALCAINSRLISARENLKNTNFVALTWGTSFVFELCATNAIVNNCHKLPANNFVRRRISIDEITQCYSDLIARLKAYNSNVKVIITVSPVRHLADGLAGNQLSKSILRVASQTLAEQYSDTVIYFPSYEALLDDLRDYRFYADDMVHPSKVTEEYIYNLFIESFCNADTIAAAAECRKYTKRLEHRIMTTDLKAVEKFRNATVAVYNNLIKKYPYLEGQLQIPQP